MSESRHLLFSYELDEKNHILVAVDAGLRVGSARTTYDLSK
jgi:hypothetical protein